MTYRQKFLKTVYPLWVLFNKISGARRKIIHQQNKEPLFSFYALRSTLINGTEMDFESLKGKKVLLVNTASDCGYTPQYAELELLQKQYQSTLVILGFPSNDFRQQEKQSNEAIADFCQVNYGVSFPMMQKSVVKRARHQHPVYEWLTNPLQNGWNLKQPSWNFSKYLVNEEGRLTDYFDPSVAPLGPEIKKALKQS